MGRLITTGISWRAAFIFQAAVVATIIVLMSNLGSSFGTAIAGTILVSGVGTGNQAYALAMVALAVVGLIGLGAATLLPADPERGRSVDLSPHPSSELGS